MNTDSSFSFGNLEVRGQFPTQSQEEASATRERTVTIMFNGGVHNFKYPIDVSFRGNQALSSLADTALYNIFKQDSDVDYVLINLDKGRVTYGNYDSTSETRKTSKLFSQILNQEFKPKEATGPKGNEFVDSLMGSVNPLQSRLASLNDQLNKLQKLQSSTENGKVIRGVVNTEESGKITRPQSQLLQSKIDACKKDIELMELASKDPRKALATAEKLRRQYETGQDGASRHDSNIEAISDFIEYLTTPNYDPSDKEGGKKIDQKLHAARNIETTFRFEVYNALAEDMKNYHEHLGAKADGAFDGISKIKDKKKKEGKLSELVRTRTRQLKIQEARIRRLENLGPTLWLDEGNGFAIKQPAKELRQILGNHQKEMNSWRRGKLIRGA